MRLPMKAGVCCGCRCVRVERRPRVAGAGARPRQVRRRRVSGYLKACALRPRRWSAKPDSSWSSANELSAARGGRSSPPVGSSTARPVGAEILLTPMTNRFTEAKPLTSGGCSVTSGDASLDARRSPPTAPSRTGMAYLHAHRSAIHASPDLEPFFDLWVYHD